MPYRPYNGPPLPKPGELEAMAQRPSVPRLSELRVREPICRVEDANAPARGHTALLPANTARGRDFEAERRRSEHEFAMAMYAPLIKAIELRVSLQKTPERIKELVEIVKYARDVHAKGVGSATTGLAEKQLHKAIAKEIVRRIPGLAGHEKLIERTLKETISIRDRVFKEGGGKLDREPRAEKPTRFDVMP